MWPNGVIRYESSPCPMCRTAGRARSTWGGRFMQIFDSTLSLTTYESVQAATLPSTSTSPLPSMAVTSRRHPNRFAFSLLVRQLMDRCTASGRRGRMHRAQRRLRDGHRTPPAQPGTVPRARQRRPSQGIARAAINAAHGFGQTGLAPQSADGSYPGSSAEDNRQIRQRGAVLD